jgi:hypothetical protein
VKKITTVAWPHLAVATTRCERALKALGGRAGLKTMDSFLKPACFEYGADLMPNAL